MRSGFCIVRTTRRYSAPTRRRIAFVTDCRTSAIAAHGSAFRFASHPGTFATSKRPGSTPGTSSHETGIATVAPGRARAE
jgi:hypothetical protein